ncbi:hypothetical protein BH10ACT9_BH10ACT9_09150 [soil metagenome]
MDSLLAADLGDWIWARHQNMWSWYIRPLFLLPLAWFAYRRSATGIVVTLFALFTSMFWFPAPATRDPRAEEFLAFEQAWLTADWDATKVGLTLLVPVALTAYCAAFWRRSLPWGLVVLNVMAVGKLTWGVVAGDGSGWAMTLPALVGLAIGDVVLVTAWLFLRRRRSAARLPHRRCGLAAPAGDRYRHLIAVHRRDVDGGHRDQPGEDRS